MWVQILSVALFTNVWLSCIHHNMTINHFRGNYAFLSNFAPFSVFFEGVYYPSTENAYQAAKTTNLELRKEFEVIRLGKQKGVSATRILFFVLIGMILNFK